MPEIKLTLDRASAPQTPEIKTELVQVEEDKQAAARFSPEEEKMINEFAQKIDVTDPNLVFAYGSACQQNIAQFSDSALASVQLQGHGRSGRDGRQPGDRAERL